MGPVAEQGSNAPPGAPADLVELGFLRGAYGLRGWVHLQPHSADAQVLRTARTWWLLGPRDAPVGRAAESGDEVRGEFAQALVVTGVRAQGAALVAKWRGCDDPETAQALRGRAVAVARSEFPALSAGEYYWVDLIGAQVVNRQGECLGVVRGLRANGAHDVLEIEPTPGTGADGGGPMLVPMVEAYIDAVELAQRRIRVDWDPSW